MLLARQNDVTWADAFTAVGTVGAVVVALLIGILNSGWTTANGVTAIFQNWWDFDEDGDEWTELDADPLPMKWISIRPADDRPDKPPTVSILPNCTEFLDVILWRNTEIELLVDDGRQTLFYHRRSPAVGIWRVQFAVAGDNCAVAIHTVEFECDGRNYISRVESAEPPHAARHAGLFHALGGLASTSQEEDSGGSNTTTSTEQSQSSQ